MTKLIVTADDFGMSTLYNKDILDLAKTGCLSRASVMTRYWLSEQWKDCKKLQWLRGDDFSIGLHVDFERSNEDYDVMLSDQRNMFVKIFDNIPTHIDIHKSWAYQQSLPLVLNFAKKHGIAVRNEWFESVIWIKTTTHQVQHGTWMRRDDIIQYLEVLWDDTYEILFHPWQYDPQPPYNTSLNHHRAIDTLQLYWLADQIKTRQISYSV